MYLVTNQMQTFEVSKDVADKITQKIRAKQHFRLKLKGIELTDKDVLGFSDTPSKEVSTDPVAYEKFKESVMNSEWYLRAKNSKSRPSSDEEPHQQSRPLDEVQMPRQVSTLKTVLAKKH